MTIFFSSELLLSPSLMIVFSLFNGLFLFFLFFIKIATIRAFGFSQKFFAKITLNFVIIHVCLIFCLKNLFLSIDLFMITTWSSLVTKVASFGQRYFFLIGTCLLKTWKIESLKNLDLLPLNEDFEFQI